MTQKDDLISRQAVIDALSCENPTETYIDYDDAVKAIRQLPPAEPDLPIKEKCAFCPHCNNCDVNDDLSIQPCVDTISRQQAIDTIRNIILGFFSDEDGVMNDTEKTLLSVNKAVCNGVRELPPAEPYTDEEIQAMQDLEQAQLDKAYELGWKEGRR